MVDDEKKRHRTPMDLPGARHALTKTLFAMSSYELKRLSVLVSEVLERRGLRPKIIWRDEDMPVAVTGSRRRVLTGRAASARNGK